MTSMADSLVDRLLGEAAFRNNMEPTISRLLHDAATRIETLEARFPIKSGPNAQLDQTDADNFYLAQENRELRARIETLEQERDELKARIANALA
jgi:cell division protein FtsB